jgi:hypothetical protein
MTKGRLVFGIASGALSVAAPFVILGVVISTLTVQLGWGAATPMFATISTTLFLLLLLGAMPGFIVLLYTKPRLPIAERNALFAPLVWFLRSVWASIIFVMAAIVGAISGATVSFSSDIHRPWGVLFSTAFVPLVLAVAALSFVIMGGRWALDLAWLRDHRKGKKSVLRFWRSWRGAGNLRPAELVAIRGIDYWGRQLSQPFIVLLTIFFLILVFVWAAAIVS